MKLGKYDWRICWCCVRINYNHLGIFQEDQNNGLKVFFYIFSIDFHVDPAKHHKSTFYLFSCYSYWVVVIVVVVVVVAVVVAVLYCVEAPGDGC